MGYSYAYEFEEAIGLGILPALLSSVPSMAISIATYVLTALAFYTIAKRRGLSNPWLAWIPVADVWLLGSISDQYRYLVKRENKSKRKILLILSIISTICGLIAACLGIGIVVNAVSGMMYSASEEELIGRIVGPAIGVLGICVPLAGVGIAYVIIRYMALWDVYNSLDPRNAVMFLVLSIVFGITEPFFLFFNRNRDDGMPPRKQQYTQPSYEQPAYDYSDYERPAYQKPQEPAEEPWSKDEPDYL